MVVVAVTDDVQQKRAVAFAIDLTPLLEDPTWTIQQYRTDILTGAFEEWGPDLDQS